MSADSSLPAVPANPAASPDQDFLKLVDDLISKAIFRGRDGYGGARFINGSYEERQKAVDAAQQSLVAYVAKRHQCYLEVLEEYKASESELSALKESALTGEEATEIIDWLPVDATYLDSHPVIESARTKIFRVARRISSSGGNKE